MKSTTTFVAVLAALSASSVSQGQSPAPAPPGPKTAPAASPAAAYTDKIAKKAPETTAKSATSVASPPVPTAVAPSVSVSASPVVAATPAVAATALPAVVVVTQPAAPAPPPANNWAGGVLGILILGVGGYYGLRYAQKRGITVADSLQKLGVEMPQDGVNGPATIAHLKPPPPTVASLPPLPSLAGLPEAASQGSGVRTAVTSAPAKRAGVGNLLGTLGPVEGKQLTVPANAPLTMGRDSDNTLPLPDDTTVSRRHARIEAIGDGKGDFQIVDEGSSNGTYINGQRLTAGQARALVVGDEIQIGASRLRFEG